MANKISLDFKDNPALRDALGGKKIGDRCTVTIKFQIDRLTEEGAEGTIQSIEPEGYAPGPNINNGESKIFPDGAREPVMVVVAGRAAKAASRKTAAAATGKGY